MIPALATANIANKISLSTKKIEEFEKKTLVKSRIRIEKQSTLIDIMNDSPIIGLAMGEFRDPIFRNV
ncbi:hypothetical protein RDI58_024565 [Solanum bulbocastanum]|uniref:Uncharacterized protein n=1 Tax=Solanum bulbocastanum TaxID=147425 RepID=A0AAN8T250_SOLBU